MHRLAGIEYPWQGILEGVESECVIACACLGVVIIGSTESHRIEKTQELFLYSFVLHGARNEL
jgi:hypothetical protein